jgi:hypothetical protein
MRLGTLHLSKHRFRRADDLLNHNRPPRAAHASLSTRLFALTGLLALVFALQASPALADMELVMVEEEGCIYCAQWNADIAQAYPRTAEGRAAPLRRVDIHAVLLDDIELTSRPVFTPTFILVDDGLEVARLEGYPGEEFFWFLLGQMLDEHVPDWSAPTEETN